MSLIAPSSSSAMIPALDPDVRLMLAVRADDANAFEELVAKYQARLRTFLHYLLPDDCQVDDLVQDVFLRVFRARKSYQPTARFATWVYRIARNVAKNARRTKARRREIQLISPAGNDSQCLNTMEQIAKDASGLMPTRQADRNEIGRSVQAALQMIGERQRMAILLCKFEGMSYQEVAETMDLSVPAVKSLINRGRTSLRDALQPYYREGKSVTSTALGEHPARE